MSEAYEKFLDLVREIGQLDTIAQLLDWDSELTCPGTALPFAAEQLAVVAALSHERRSGNRLGDLLAQLEGNSLDPVQATNVREMRRSYDRRREGAR